MILYARHSILPYLIYRIYGTIISGTSTKKKKDAGKNVICSLMIDEMAIKKHVSWDGKKYRGYVDLGNDVEDDDSAPLAKDALVFMVVGINESWKVPVGYFFIDGLSGKERANLIKVCLKKLHDVGMDVISLICDGPSCHFAMLHALGAQLQLPNIKPYFLHPMSYAEAYKKYSRGWWHIN